MVKAALQVSVRLRQCTTYLAVSAWHQTARVGTASLAMRVLPWLLPTLPDTGDIQAQRVGRASLPVRPSVASRVRMHSSPPKRLLWMHGRVSVTVLTTQDSLACVSIPED